MAATYLEQRTRERERIAAAREKVHRLVSEGHSLTSAAGAAGVSKGTAWKWVRQPSRPAARAPRRATPPPAARTARRTDAVLDARPLADWLNRLVGTRFDDLDHAARSLGVDEAWLRRLMSPKPGARMTLKAVDNIITRAGDVHMLSILYPLDDDQEGTA